MTSSKRTMNQKGSPPSAPITQPALNLPDLNLMERIVASENVHVAWTRVKSNRGSAGSDGMNLDEFPDYARAHWARIRQSLLEGDYEPLPVRRVVIPKPDGGQRNLGIPSVVDRVIQQAVLQVLTPMFDPTFSESSFGFRPGRSAHGAVKQVKRHVAAGYGIAVDLDLEKFFDRVQHDVLMQRVARRVKDRRVLHLIGRYLRAGVMVGGVFERTEEGTPQGGPLSPVLANILLDDLDKELEKRGLRFSRYADDLLILVRSLEAARRVKESVTRFLNRTLKLSVNEKKSKVAPIQKCTFLGFGFLLHRGFGKKGLRTVVSDKAMKKFKARVRELTGRSTGISWERRLEELNRYLRGWLGYFALSETKRIWPEIDEWIRRRMRMCLWKQWKRPRTRIRNLLALDVPRKIAVQHGRSQKGPWRLSKTLGAHFGLTKDWFRVQGLTSLRYLWGDLAPLRRTAGCGTRTSGGVGAGEGNLPGYPIMLSMSSSQRSESLRPSLTEAKGSEAQGRGREVRV